MNRDSDILRTFEIADDSLQGVLGYHLYATSMQQVANESAILTRLPDEKIPHTFSWFRYYDKQDLVNAFRVPVFELYQSRISLIAMTNVFEVALDSFILSLGEKGYPPKFKKKYPSYKDHIEWAYLESLKCDIGDKEAINRLPTTFGIVDNARRLRNLIVHNQGLFDTPYESQAIVSNNIQTEFVPDYWKFKKNQKLQVPIVMVTNDIVRFSMAHIEVLHVLHNGLQKRYFGFPEPYDYGRARKGIEWNKILWGSAKVKLLMYHRKIN
jgi:hypothetical protein